MSYGKSRTPSGIWVGGKVGNLRMESILCSVMPGLVPAAELVVCRIPKGATFVAEAKVTKTIDAPSGRIGLGGRRTWMRAVQLAALKQGPPISLSVLSWGRRQASVMRNN